MGCVTDMVRELGGTVAKALFLVELNGLPGRKLLEEKNVLVESVVEI